METRKCKLCGSEKPVNEFRRTKIGKSGQQLYDSYCRPCNSEKCRMWKVRNPERARANQSRWNRDNRRHLSEWHRCRKYGFTKESLAEFLDSKNGICEICGKHQSSCGIPHNIDHDHDTGKVRGLLCSSCNRAIGYLQDNPDLVDRASAYLRLHKPSTPA